MIFVIIGAPGAGKGTQGDLLAKKLHLKKVSTGDALRAQIKQKTKVGLTAEGIMAQGKLLPDDVLLEIVRAEIGENTAQNVLLDGYPRTISQAKALESLSKKQPLGAVIHLDVPNDELLRRLSGRRTCEKCGKPFEGSEASAKGDANCPSCGGKLIRRVDDDPEKVLVRLKVFEEQTAPVIDFYKREGGIYSRVDGMRGTDAVFEDVAAIVRRSLGQQ